MGRKNRNLYFKTLHQQAHEKLVSMQASGDSRSADKLTGADQNKICSHATYETYHRAVMRFVKYMKEHHPECTTLKKSNRAALLKASKALGHNRIDVLPRSYLYGL